MKQYEYILGIVKEYTDKPEELLARLQEEGVLSIGYGNENVDNIISAFKETFGTTRSSRWDRYAAHRLARKYNSTTIVNLIRALGVRSSEIYCPVVNSVSDVEKKLPSIIRFLTKGTTDTIQI